MNFLQLSAIVAAISLALAATAFTLLCLAAKRPYRASRADCAILLGAKLRPNGTPTRTLHARVEATAHAYKQKMFPRIILCGGLAQCYGGISEARAMKNALIQKGVPEEHLLLDELSVDTEDNLLNAIAFMNSRQWRSAVIITSDYHLPRALRLAKDLHLQASGIAAPSPKGKTYWKARLREMLGWGLYVRNRCFRALGIKANFRAR